MILLKKKGRRAPNWPLFVALSAASALLPISRGGATGLFGSDGLDPSFCKLPTVRQTVVYVDDKMMVEGKVDWAQRLTSKLKATLQPGEKVTVVQLSPDRGQSEEIWDGCWPNLNDAQKAEIAKGTYIFTKSPIDSLGDQQKFFIQAFGAALSKIYESSKRPAQSVEFDASKSPKKQILRGLASDEGRFSNSSGTVRAVVYSDMIENSDLGSVVAASPGAADRSQSYADKLGSHLRHSVFYAFGVASDISGGTGVPERAKTFWANAIKDLGGTLGGFGADLNVANRIPVKSLFLNTELEFSGQKLDGKLSMLVDSDGNLVDSWIGFSRLSIAGLTGTLACQSDVCKLDGATTSGIVTTSPTEVVLLSGKPAEMTGQLGVKGTQTMFGLKATLPNT